MSRSKQRINGDTIEIDWGSAQKKMSRRDIRDVFFLFEFVRDISAKRQCETAANSGECIKDWNFWSSLLK